MIERKFVAENVRLFQVKTFVIQKLGLGKIGDFEIKKTPLGEKIIIYTARPGLVVGRKGENIRELTKVLKSKFRMENPQIEVSEIERPDLDAQTVAEQIVNVLERFGPKRFKATGYRTLQRIIDAGALGAEIVISGRGLPSTRAKTWRFYAGYLKKSGDIAMNHVRKGLAVANLKSGSVGIKVSILTKDVILPDTVDIHEIAEKTEIKVEEVKEEEKKEEVKEEKKEEKKKPVKKTKKKAPKKMEDKKEDKK